MTSTIDPNPIIQYDYSRLSSEPPLERPARYHLSVVRCSDQRSK